MAVGLTLALGFFMMLAPLALAIVAQRAWKTPWVLFWAGAAAFVASKVVQIPAMIAPQAAWLSHAELPAPATLAVVLCFAPL